MAERLPLPTRVNNSSSTALDPTEVIPGPQPVDQMTTEVTRVISGELVDGAAGPYAAGQARHRGGRGRRTGRTAVGTAVLSATGAVAGLGLLMSHESGNTSAKSPEAAKETPDRASDESLDPSFAAAASAPLKATGGPQTAETTLPRTAAGSAAESTKTSSTSSAGKHARPSGSWDSSDWQEAIERAAAAQRAAQGEQGGRHRADEGSGYDGNGYGNGRYGGDDDGYGGGYGGGYGYGGGPGYGYGS